ncbi:MAG: SMP-30/gluconolactonase/LRE family protein [Acidobacteria bacterium]|nr:SMP-30/gluconolactonase/LRE family protein [Acidobacteriota bacterium]MDA1234177.1 SMP-30/gluconolactonase/LRE family protein [Acidobacteriota bacterium]
MKSILASLTLLCVVSIVPAFAQGQANNRGSHERPADTVAPAIPGVVAAGTKVTVIGHHFQNTEGPVALPDGSLIFTETRGSLITKIDKDDNVSPFLENTNRSNGLGFDSKGRLISVQALSVGVVYPKGSEALLAGPYEVRPNDLVVSSKDRIYFTLPGNKPPAVFYIPPGGKAVFAAEAPGPHGIQLSPDEGTLYVADSNGEYLVAFDVQSDGGLTNRRNFGRYAGVTKTDSGYDSHADGIAVDSEGRVYVGTMQGVQVFSPQGQHLGLIPVSQRPQNLAFAGPDKKTLYIAGQGAMYRLQMLAQGYKGRPK